MLNTQHSKRGTLFSTKLVTFFAAIQLLMATVSAQQDFQKWDSEQMLTQVTDSEHVQVESIHKFEFADMAGLKNIKWDYSKNGTDWDFPNCNNENLPQSPRDMIHANRTNPNMFNYDWFLYFYSFIPTYRPTKITTKGINAYVYMI